MLCLLHHRHVQGPQRPDKGSEALRTRANDCERPEVGAGNLEEQPVLLTHKSVHTKIFITAFFIFMTPGNEQRMEFHKNED